MMRPPARSTALLASTLVLGLAACGSGDGEGAGDVSPPASDTIAPFTSATPGGGLYSEAQFVSLSASEPAIIYYTVDGNTPTVGGPTTISGISPISNLLVSSPTTLRYFAIDLAGNQEFPKAEQYSFDAVPPGLFISDFLTGTYGFLETIDVIFSSDEVVNYLLEVGGDGTPGTGSFVSSGQVQPSEVQHADLPGWQLPVGAQNPGASVWLHVVDAAQNLTSFEFEVKTQLDASVALGGTTTQFEFSDDGARAFLLDEVDETIRIFDLDDQSPTFHTVIAEIGVGANPTGFDVTDDESRLYVANDGGFTEVDLVAETALAIPMPGGRTPSGVAIHVKKAALVGADDGTFWQLDVDPQSNFFRIATQLLMFTETLMTHADITLGADRSHALVVWQGGGFYGARVFTTDIDSLLFLQVFPLLLEGPTPVSIGRAAVSADGTQAWLGNLQGNLARASITTLAPSLQIASPNLAMSGVTPTPDESLLFVSGENLIGLRIVDPDSLVERAFVPANGSTSAGTSDQVRFTPDGQFAYLVRDNGTPSAEFWILTLTSQ